MGSIRHGGDAPGLIRVPDDRDDEIERLRAEIAELHEDLIDVGGEVDMAETRRAALDAAVRRAAPGETDAVTLRRAMLYADWLTGDLDEEAAQAEWDAIVGELTATIASPNPPGTVILTTPQPSRLRRAWRWLWDWLDPYPPERRGT